MDAIARLTGLHADDHPQEVKTEQPEDAALQVTLRALVTTKEAGAIIGKGGQNVADVREKTGVKAGVSKVLPGVHERILTVTGPLDQVAKAYALFAGYLLDNANQTGETQQDQATIRILISHLLMGAVIGTC
jgi:heterogeneous nuclear rnp K-like protein 2